jgi:hypothetical protein
MASVWAFRTNFRRGALGWRSSHIAVERVRAAVDEITREAGKNPGRSAEGIVVLFERISPAFENVDDSSGYLGDEIRAAIDDLVPKFRDAPLSDAERRSYLTRLWKAVEDDDMPWIERLEDRWGDLCESEPIATHWAEWFDLKLRVAEAESERVGRYVNGRIALLSTLFRLRRFDELMHIVDKVPYKFWPYRRWGFQSLAELGRPDEAIRYALERNPIDTSYLGHVASACETLLLSFGRIDEAYDRFAFDAMPYRRTYLARFKELAAKYPGIDRRRILSDLIAKSPGEEGKWFAAAMAAKMPDVAVRLAQDYPSDPKTLIRAAAKGLSKDPRLAYDLCLSALRWLGQGFGYEVTAFDVLDTFRIGQEAAQSLGLTPTEYRETVRPIVSAGHKFVRQALETQLDDTE